MQLLHKSFSKKLAYLSPIAIDLIQCSLIQIPLFPSPCFTEAPFTSRIARVGFWASFKAHHGNSQSFLEIYVVMTDKMNNLPRMLKTYITSWLVIASIDKNRLARYSQTIAKRTDPLTLLKRPLGMTISMVCYSLKLPQLRQFSLYY